MFAALNRRLTAIALANGGDFDGVRDVLRGDVLALDSNEQKTNKNARTETVMTEQNLSHKPVGIAGQR